MNTSSDPALDRDARPATRGYVFRLIEKVANGLGDEMGRMQLDERQRSAGVVGALEALIAEMESRHQAEVSVLRADLVKTRAEIEQLKEAQAEAGPRQLRVVS